MSSRDQINRRQLTKLAGGAAALSLGVPILRTSAQDDAAATEAANATATAEAEGVQVTTEEEGKPNVTWWTHNNSAFVQANTDLITKLRGQESRYPHRLSILPVRRVRPETANRIQLGHGGRYPADVRHLGHELRQIRPARPGSGRDGLHHGERFWQAAYGAYELDGAFYGQPKEYNLENGGLLVNPALIESAGVG